MKAELKATPEGRLGRSEIRHGGCGLRNDELSAKEIETALALIAALYICMPA
jgi:hypothetical protein